MNPQIMLELASRWERDAKAPEIEAGGEENLILNATERGESQGKRECADTLRMLVQLLG